MKSKKGEFILGRKVLILILIMSLQSCALLTSFKNFSLERNPTFTFNKEKTFYDSNMGFMVFYDDGTFLLINLSTRERIESHLKNINYKIYNKFSDSFFHWGVYRVEQDSIQIELLEKVHQWGFMGITRWNGVLNDKGNEIEIFPGPVNRRGRNVYAPTFTYEGGVFLQDHSLSELNLKPEKSWVNR